MKTKILFFSMSLFLLFSCSKKDKQIDVLEQNNILTKDAVFEESKTIEYYMQQYQQYELLNFLLDKSIDRIDDIRLFFENDNYYQYSKVANLTIQNDIQLFSFNNSYIPIKEKIILNETEIKVIGHLYDREHEGKTDYLLVKKEGNGLFDGWVNENDLSFHISQRELYLFPPIINISPNNEYITCISNIYDKDSLVISNKMGDRILYIPINTIELPEKYIKYRIDYNFIGWGSNGLACYDAHADSPKSLVYVIIDFQNGSYRVIPSMETSNIIINYDTGDCLYSDEEHILGVIEDDIEKMNNNIVNIYYSNIYSKNVVFVNSIKGYHVNFTYGPNNELLYLNENDEYIEYKPNQSN